VSLALFYGTFMRGQPGEANLAGATFVEEVSTAPRYRLYSMRDEHPLLVEVMEGGASIEGQLFDVPDELWARIFAAEPPGLHVTEIELADGRVVQGMLGEPQYAERQGVEITDYGGWAAYVTQKGS
jgi:gamma-glutamylaminecyclotransferase